MVNIFFGQETVLGKGSPFLKNGPFKGALPVSGRERGGGENACQDDMGHFFVHPKWTISCFLGGQDASQDCL